MDKKLEKKYVPLAQFFQNSSKIEITLTFEMIENIMGQSLPNAAYLNASWWKKTKPPLTHYFAWLNSEYYVVDVRLGHSITFSKLKQTADNIITYAALGLNSKEEAEAAFGVVASSFQGIDGVTHSMDYQDDQVTETLIVDYGVADFEEVAQLEGSTFDDTDADYISLEKTIELLEDQGFEQVE